MRRHDRPGTGSRGSRRPRPFARGPASPAGRGRPPAGRSARELFGPRLPHAAGASTSARSTRPRARSSASTSPAWMVLPSPTASASSMRVTPSSTASAGASCHGSRSMRASGAVHSPRSGPRPRQRVQRPCGRPHARRRRTGAPIRGRIDAIERQQQGRVARVRARRLRRIERDDGTARSDDGCHARASAPRVPARGRRAPGPDRSSSIACHAAGRARTARIAALAPERGGQGKGDARPKKAPLQRDRLKRRRRWSGQEAIGSQRLRRLGGRAGARAGGG